jgi:hypothetical protein
MMRSGLCLLSTQAKFLEHETLWDLILFSGQLIGKLTRILPYADIWQEEWASHVTFRKEERLNLRCNLDLYFKFSAVSKRL